ncbi:light-induced protein brain protein 44 [Danaus plexippus plexippus]|uniref:Mitochondrial pyruvate carrier n=1 Tax=Danaus plexippus plexippus TaxID=278856 RepID=A0A212FD19_DANPL|nr:light-induced protein brain protein 44 [Danaus plexippus plexippus]
MSKLYKAVVNTADKFVPSQLRPLWEHAAGPKTIFFWAPAFKWGLVVAGLGDLNRPAETLSISQSLSLAITGGLVMAGLGDLTRPVESLSIPQSASLAATGIIWSRYSLVIIPKNYSLFAVNVFVAITSVYQISRAIRHQQSLKKAEK